MKASDQTTSINMIWTYRLAASQSCPAAIPCKGSLIVSSWPTMKSFQKRFNTLYKLRPQTHGHSQDTTSKTCVTKHWKHRTTNSARHTIYFCMATLRSYKHRRSFYLTRSFTFSKHWSSGKHKISVEPRSWTQQLAHVQLQPASQVAGAQRFECWGCRCWCMRRLYERGERNETDSRFELIERLVTEIKSKRSLLDAEPWH